MFLRYLEHPPFVAYPDPGSSSVLLYHLRMDPDHDNSSGLNHELLRREMQPIIDRNNRGDFRLPQPTACSSGYKCLRTMPWGL